MLIIEIAFGVVVSALILCGMTLAVSWVVLTAEKT